MTPQELQQAIEANTRVVSQLSNAVDVLVTQFIRPTAQQAVANRARLERIEDLLDRHAQAIVDIDERLDRLVSQVEATTNQTARNAEDISELRVLHRENQQSLQILIDEGRADRQAQRETLQAILANSRRLDRLEQQAS